MNDFGQVFSLSVAFCNALERLKNFTTIDPRMEESLSVIHETINGLADSLDACIPNHKERAPLIQMLEILRDEIDTCIERKQISQQFGEYLNSVLSAFNLQVFPTIFKHFDLIEDVYIEEKTKLLPYLFTPAVEIKLQSMAGIYYTRALASSEPRVAYDTLLNSFELTPNLLSAGGDGYEYEKAEESYLDKCPLCGADGEDYFCAHTFLMMGPNDNLSPAKLWMKCTDCGLIYAWNYSKEHIAANEVDNQKFSSSFKVMREFLSRARGKKLLHLGGGYTNWINEVKTMGFDVTTIDSNMDFSQSGEFDIIIMAEALETTAKPKELIQKTFHALSAGGMLWIATPNFACQRVQVRKFADMSWLEPYHMTYFNQDILATLLQEEGYIGIETGTEEAEGALMYISAEKKI